MSQNEQNFEDELKLKPANIQELHVKLELAKIELETKKLKLEPETLKMLHEENSRVREHEIKMAELRNEEMRAFFELQIKLELAKTELGTKKLEPETMKMLHYENSRVREHEIKMAELKTEEMKAQFEIDKQRFEERQMVTKEFKEKEDEMNEKMNAIQTELQQAKQNGGMDLKNIVLAISSLAMFISSHFGLVGTAAASQMVAGVAAVTPMVKKAIINS